MTTVCRKQGIPIAVYLDDGLGAGRNLLSARSNNLTVHSVLLKAGFIINEGKSVWDPVQETTWLGYTINTKKILFKQLRSVLTNLHLHLETLFK